MQAVIVQTTVADGAAAEALAAAVLEARMAACAHMFPVRSRYWWDGRVEQAEETVLAFKTACAKAAPLMEFIRARHAYDVPELIMIPIGGGDPAYLDWILGETEGAGRTGHE